MSVAVGFNPRIAASLDHPASRSDARSRPQTMEVHGQPSLHNGNQFHHLGTPRSYDACLMFHYMVPAEGEAALPP